MFRFKMTRLADPVAEASAIEVDILSEAEGLQDEWWSLWHRDPRATPFQSPAWLVPWRRHFNDGESAVLTLRQNGRLVALIPFFSLEGRLLLWGAGTSDRLDGVFDPEMRADALRAALARLGQPLDLCQLPAQSPLLNLPAPDGWTEQRGTSESCAVLKLPTRPNAHLKEKLLYYRRRAAREGLSGPLQVGADCVEALAALHTRRWNKREEPGVFADRRFLAWQKDAAILLERAGLLRFYALKSAGAVAAVLHIVAAKGSAFYYIGGFDPDLARLGPGTLLLGHAIEEAEREGLSTFDFLRGQEAYKYRWGAADEPTYARRLFPRG